jgi:bacteriocin-like protein
MTETKTANCELTDNELDQVSGGTELDQVSGEDSLRLQMYMEQRSKFMQTASNILHSIAGTGSKITQNMK